MNCPNCGAPLEENANSCKYCGCENFEFKTNQKKWEINKIYQKIFSMLGFKDRITKRATKILTILTILVVIIFIISLLFTFAYSIFAPKIKYATQQANIKKLEEIYQTKDYDKLYEELDKMGLEGYSSVYDKYYDVANLSKQLVLQEENIKENISYYKQSNHDNTESIGMYLKYLFDCLEKCQAQKDLGYPFDNEAVYEDFNKRIIHLLKDEYLLTDEEIAKGLKQVIEGNDRDFSPFGELVLSRLKEDY